MQHQRLKQLVTEASPKHSRENLIVGLFKKFAGCFWKNPDVIKDKTLIGNLFYILPTPSQMTILPYLRQWVYRNAKPAARSKSQQEFEVDVSGSTDAPLFTLKLAGSLTLRSRPFEFWSVTGVVPYVEPVDEDNESGGENDEDSESDDGWGEGYRYNPDEMVQAHFPDLRIVGDIEKEKPDPWWYVNYPDFGYTLTDRFLMKWYEENGGQRCKIYASGIGWSASLRTPESSWSPDYWDLDFDKKDRDDLSVGGIGSGFVTNPS
jgi:hypothetical protein